MILFKNVSKSYIGGFQALQNISFDIKKGEFVFLCGHSGAGKSSLIKLISMLEFASMGKIVFDGIDITKVSENEIPYIRRSIGLIFQDYKLINNKTVFDNVALPLIIRGYNQRIVETQTNSTLELLGLLSKRNCYPLSLSGGEQQRVGIARAIVFSPKIILADEPTGNLDEELTKEVINIFSNLNKSGTTIVVATHDQGVINQRPARKLVLSKGRLVKDII